MAEETPPKLARRSANRRSALKTGRTLSAKREHLETSSERAASHQKIKRRARFRFTFATIVSLLIVATVVWLVLFILGNNQNIDSTQDCNTTSAIIYKPTIEIIDEDAGTTGTVTSRMSEYIGQAEVDFREYGLIPTKAVIPTGAIREVDFYLDGYSGYIKMILDRDTAVSVEDASRMIRYLEDQQGITDYQYIDVRLPGKAYWK